MNKFDFWQDDIRTNEKGIPVSVVIYDLTKSDDYNVFRKYKLYENTLGSYIVFHGKREYILEK